MKKPNAPKLHCPGPSYLRGLIEQAGLTQEEAAILIGVAPRTMRNYLSLRTHQKAPYSVQYALEALAKL